jgi:hypothetical protein
MMMMIVVSGGNQRRFAKDRGSSPNRKRRRVAAGKKTRIPEAKREIDRRGRDGRAFVTREAMRSKARPSLELLLLLLLVFRLLRFHSLGRRTRPSFAFIIISCLAVATRLVVAAPLCWAVLRGSS